MRHLKLTGAETYVGPRSNQVLVYKGDIVAMEDKDADEVLKEVNVNASNNERPLFTEVHGSPVRAKPAAKEVDGEPKAPPVARTKRAAKPKVAAAIAP